MNHEQLKPLALFGLDKDFLLKNQLLQILDNSPTYISTTELAKRISGASLDTIQQVCRSIKEDLELIYPQKECQLVINQRHGIKLERQGKSFDRVLIYYGQQELAVLLLQELLLYRELISYDFLEERHISESTLRRKIKTLNQSFNNYNLHITYSQKIRLNGPEVAIRSFYFIFLFLLYRQVSNLSFIAERGYFETRGKKIQQYLKLPLTLKEIDVFALVYYAHEHGVHTGIPLRLTEQEKKLFNQFDLPSKPTFLNNWSLDDWQFFLLFLYASNLFEHDFSVKPLTTKQSINQNITNHWIQTFEAYFHLLTSKEKELISQMVTKTLLFNFFIKIENDLFHLFSLIDFDTFNEQDPHYAYHFQLFWEDFCVKVPELNYDYFRLISLMLAVNFAPLDVRLYSIKIFVYSEFSTLFANYIKERLVMQFKTQYDITFTAKIEEAELIISTLPLSNLEIKNIPRVIIRPFLSANDFIRIDTKIQELIEELKFNSFK